MEKIRHRKSVQKRLVDVFVVRAKLGLGMLKNNATALFYLDDPNVCQSIQWLEPFAINDFLNSARTAKLEGDGPATDC